MAPVSIPAEQIEFLTVSGTGTLLLTLPQRTARRLTVSIEKIKTTALNSYYNFRIPEPSAFWGYLQLVQRDFIESTIELKYRREVVLNIDHYELEPIEQLRCLVKDSTLLLFDNLTPLLLAAGGDPAAIGTDRANYLLNNGQPRLIPAIPTTAIYYEIPAGFFGLISIIWQDYAEPCVNAAGKQALPAPRSPGKDESGGGSSGGGGTRPTTPVPPGRGSDPDSDIPAPPPDSPAGPDSPAPAPPPAPITYRVIWTYTTCSRIIGTNQFTMETSGPITQTGPGPFSTSSETQNGTPSIGIRDALGSYTAGVTGAITANNPCATAAFITIVSQAPFP